MLDYRVDARRSKKGKESRKQLLLMLGIVLVIAFLLQAAIRALVIYPVHIKTKAMEPAITRGDRVFIFYSEFTEVERNQVYLVEQEKHNAPLLCRAAALEGDTISIANKTVYVNGKEASIPRQVKDKRNIPRSLLVRDNMAQLQIRPDYFFCLFDNHDQLGDSRTWGPLKISQVKGRAIYKNFLFQKL